jgi:hypothetical protein
MKHFSKEASRNLFKPPEQDHFYHKRPKAALLPPINVGAARGRGKNHVHFQYFYTHAFTLRLCVAPTLNSW